MLLRPRPRSAVTTYKRHTQEADNEAAENIFQEIISDQTGGIDCRRGRNHRYPCWEWRCVERVRRHLHEVPLARYNRKIGKPEGVNLECVRCRDISTNRLRGRSDVAEEFTRGVDG